MLATSSTYLLDIGYQLRYLVYARWRSNRSLASFREPWIRCRRERTTNNSVIPFFFDRAIRVPICLALYFTFLSLSKFISSREIRATIIVKQEIEEIIFNRNICILSITQVIWNYLILPSFGQRETPKPNPLHHNRIQVTGLEGIQLPNCGCRRSE